MTPQPGSKPPYDKLLVALLGGVALGALLVAVTSETTGREVRATFRALGNRLLGRTGKPADEDELVEALFI